MSGTSGPVQFSKDEYFEFIQTAANTVSDKEYIVPESMPRRRIQKEIRDLLDDPDFMAAEAPFTNIESDLTLASMGAIIGWARNDERTTDEVYPDRRLSTSDNDIEQTLATRTERIVVIHILSHTQRVKYTVS